MKDTDTTITQAAHTRGPWGLDHYDDHVSYFSPARNDDYAFRVEFPDDMPEAEAEANATLIAAAPTLLDAALLVIDRWIRGDLAEAVRMLDAAAAKATGSVI
jgi:hypothetical protein